MHVQVDFCNLAMIYQFILNCIFWFWSGINWKNLHLSIFCSSMTAEYLMIDQMADKSTMKLIVIWSRVSCPLLFTVSVVVAVASRNNLLSLNTFKHKSTNVKLFFFVLFLFSVVGFFRGFHGSYQNVEVMFHLVLRDCVTTLANLETSEVGKYFLNQSPFKE